MNTEHLDNSSSQMIANPIQYEVGEVCKCYFTEIHKNTDEKTSQQINKCQSYCRVIKKTVLDAKEYTVVLFDSEHTIKKLPGRCLRKVKTIPYTYEQASKHIGEVIERNDGCNDRKLTMIVTVVEDSDGEDDVTINSISVDEMMYDFHFRNTGAPVCDIVMLKADEALP